MALALRTSEWWDGFGGPHTCDPRTLGGHRDSRGRRITHGFEISLGCTVRHFLRKLEPTTKTKPLSLLVRENSIASKTH